MTLLTGLAVAAAVGVAPAASARPTQQFVHPAGTTATTTTLAAPKKDPINDFATFQVTVAPQTGQGDPDGTITVTDQTTTVAADAQICTSSLTDGSATCYGFFGPSVGDHTLVATYVPSSGSTYAGSASPTVDVDVDKGTIALAYGGGNSGSSCYYAKCPWGFERSFDAGDPSPEVQPTGSRIWKINGHRSRFCGTGGCYFPNGLPVGAYRFVMHYAGDANYQPLTYNGFGTITISKSPTVVKLTSNHPSANLNQRIRYAVSAQTKVDGQAFPSLGRVRLALPKLHGREVASKRKLTIRLRNNGTADFLVPARVMRPGRHRIRVFFLGGRNFKAGQATIRQVVTAAH